MKVAVYAQVGYGVGGAAVYQVMCIRAKWLISSKLYSVSVRLFPFPPGQDVKRKLRRL